MSESFTRQVSQLARKWITYHVIQCHEKIQTRLAMDFWESKKWRGLTQWNQANLFMVFFPAITFELIRPLRWSPCSGWRDHSERRFYGSANLDGRGGIQGERSYWSWERRSEYELGAFLKFWDLSCVKSAIYSIYRDSAINFYSTLQSAIPLFLPKDNRAA